MYNRTITETTEDAYYYEREKSGQKLLFRS